MRFSLVAAALALGCFACSSNPGSVTDAAADGPVDSALEDASDSSADLDAADAMPDAADASDASPDASDGAADAGPDASDGAVCTCTGISFCCNGCTANAATLGMGCDDGLFCTDDDRCNAQGACTGNVPHACPVSVTDPECTSPTCSEANGCGFEAVNELGSCNDENPGTGVDRCIAGACWGPPCECTSGPCCDGCFFRTASWKCIDDGPIGPASCTQPSLINGCEGGGRLSSPIGDRWCSGSSALCNGTRSQNGTTTSDAPCTTIDPDGSPQDPENPLLCRVDATDPLGARCRRWCEP